MVMVVLLFLLVVLLRVRVRVGVVPVERHGARFVLDADRVNKSKIV
jgi:hypothetical protein